MSLTMRLRQTRNRRIRKLERLGTFAHWSTRARRRRRVHRVSRRVTQFRERVDEKRDDIGLLSNLVRRALLTGVGASILLVSVEAVAWFFSRYNFHPVHRLTTRIDTSKYEALVAAAVGAEAVFLALFYTTVGVIASTAYQTVPGEIRQLFVQERGSRLFTRSVVRALVFGVLVMSMASLGYKPFALTIVVLALLTIFSVLSLVVLGTGLFNFFDLSSLSTPVLRRFTRALKMAGASNGRVPHDSRERLGHTRAVQALRQYRQLSTLLKERASNETAAPTRVIFQLLAIGHAYGGLKPSIPTASLWYERIPAHRNWLTLDHSRLSIALETRTGIQPELVPDRLWVERELAARLRDLLPLLLNESDWPTAIELADETTRLTSVLASRLELDEALLLHRVLSETLRNSVATSAAPLLPAFAAEHAAGTWRTFRLAAAERSVLSVTGLWLGFAQACRSISLDRLQAIWDDGVRSATSPYGIGAPRELLTILEEIARGIELEKRAEGRRITPEWWVHHYAARAMVRQLIAGTRMVFSEVEQSVFVPIDAIVAGGDAELAAVMIYDALELVSKLATHLPAVQHAVDELSRARNDNTGDDQWPDERLEVEATTLMEERLLRHLANVILQLTPDPHDDSRPDLFGQGYKVLFDATFQAIIDGRNDLAKDLFPNVMFTADRARARLGDDLAQERLRERFIFGTEPLFDLMELSGYALLIQELNGAGIWNDVRRWWDAIFSSDTPSALAEQMSGTLKTRESIFALTQGGLERTSRKMQLDRLLRSRGIVEDRYWSPIPRDPTPPHSSPIVCAFAPGDLGAFKEVEDLFLVEYLLSKLDSGTLELSSKAESLREQIERARQRAAPGTSGDEQPGFEAPSSDDDVRDEKADEGGEQT